MNCERYREMAALESGGDLAPEHAGRLEAHLAACAGCAAFRDEMTAGRDALRRWRAAVPSADLMEQVRRGVMLEVGRSGSQPSAWEWLALAARSPWGRIAAGLAVCGLVALGVWLASPRPASRVGGPAADLVTPRAPAAAARSAEPAAAAAVRGVEAVPPKQRGHTPQVGLRRPVRPAVLHTADNGSPRPAPVLRRIEIRTADPNVRIIWLVAAASPPGGL